jgi:hypothetical protein
MPSVYLRGHCSRPDDLPDTCMKCGADARHRVTRTFNWVPPWIIVTAFGGLLLYVILATVLRKSYTVAVPLCDDHKGHWSNRVLLNLGSLVVLVGGSIGLAVLVGNLATQPDDVMPFLIFLVIGAFVAWLVVVVAANATSIRPEEITDQGIRLTGVCSGFIDAYHDQEERERSARRRAADRWDDRDEARRRRRRDDEDDRPRRRDDRYRGRADEEDDRPRRRREVEDDY